eukprot:g12108.t1
MGRGQLKYRKRGGRGRGGLWLGGRRQAGRGSTGSGNSALPAVEAVPAKNRGGGHDNSTAHLPSNTERWGLSFGEDHQGQKGRRTGPASSSAVSFEETQRLLGESEWAAGTSSWRLGSAVTEAPQEREEHPTWGAAAGSSELLSLNLDMLEKCLRRSPLHERLRLPHTYTAELEVDIDIREDPALEPAQPVPLLSPKRKGGEGAERETARAAVRVGGGGQGGWTGKRVGTAAGASTSIDAREGARVVGERSAATANASVEVEGDEDGVLDALLDLPAAGAGTGVGVGGGSSRAGEPGRAAPIAGLSPTSLLLVHSDGRGENGVRTEPASNRNRGGGANEAVGVGAEATDAVGVGGAMVRGGGGGGDDANELEDWLDDMLADA